MRLAIKFKRIGMSKYISHLDMQRLFARMCKRAGLPVKYSNGFNPHINMSFASALSVGMETYGDYLEVALENPVDMEETLNVLNREAPEGIYIEKCGELPEGTPKLMAAVDSAEYVFFTKEEEAFVRAFKELLALDSCIIEKKKDNKTRKIDIRPLVYFADLDARPVKAVLALSGSESLSAGVLISELSGRAEKTLPVNVVRRELFTKFDGKRVPLDKIFK